MPSVDGPSRLFLLARRPRLQPLFAAWPRLFALCRRRPFQPVNVFEPRSSSGLPPALACYAVGHGRSFGSPSRLSPADWRNVRDRLTRSRKGGGRLHVFAVVDDDGPVGSRRLLDYFLTAIAAGQPSLLVHPYFWHLTLPEAARVTRDLESFGSFMAIAPIESLAAATQKQLALADSPAVALDADDDGLFLTPHRFLFAPFVEAFATLGLQPGWLESASLAGFASDAGPIYATDPMYGHYFAEPKSVVAPFPANPTALSRGQPWTAFVDDGHTELDSFLAEVVDGPGAPTAIYFLDSWPNGQPVVFGLGE